MKVFKFGGASVNSIDRIRNIAGILQQYQGTPLLIVISAMGKTTNALEKVVDAFHQNKKEEALALFNDIKNTHLETARGLLTKNFQSVSENLLDFFTEVEWLLHDKPVRDYDYYYDQVVCVGELLSTAIVSAYLNEEAGITNTWLDIRDIFRTDDNFRDANLDWAFTEEKVKQEVQPLLSKTNIVLTQGFIGATSENESTTLGREGSDYSAAIFANMLNADSLTIWKDVDAVMNADPKAFPQAVPIPELNYTEVIEMAYYGAQVIHPKTIKPLHNKNILLQVKSFLDSSLPGTRIHDGVIKNLPPIIVLKHGQVLLKASSKDFSFVGERPVAQLYQLFESLHIRPNLTQNGAISFICCLDDRTDKIEKLAGDAAEIFDVSVEKGLTLLTIRHYNNGLLEELTKNKIIILKQQSADTVQVLMR